MKTGASLIILLALVCGRASLRAESLDVYLLTSVGQDNIENVERALKLGANPNCVANTSPNPPHGKRFGLFHKGESPLFVATNLGSLQCIRLLLESGADPMRSPEGKPWKFALATTSKPGGTFDEALFDLLLSVVKQLPRESDKILNYIVRPAAKRGDAETLQKIEGLGFDLGAISKAGNCIASASAEGGFYKEAQEWLKENKSKFPTAKNKSIRISDAVEYGAANSWEDISLARLIDEIKNSGLKLIEKNNHGTLVWRRALAYRLPLTAMALGSPVQEASKIKPRPTQELAVLAAKDLKTMRQFQMFVDQYLSDTENPHKAASTLFTLIASEWWKANRDALEYLLKQGADINAEGEKNKRSSSQATALQALVRKGDLETAEWLLERGADINHINRDEKETVLLSAVMKGEEELEWAFAHGAVVQEEKTGRSLIAVAISMEDVDPLISILLKQGADPYLGEEKKMSAIDFLANRRDISWLRKLDTKGRYRKLIKIYTPPADSPFIGVWWNNKDGFYTFSLTLMPDGQALIGTSVMTRGAFPWRRLKPDQIVIEIFERGNKTDLLVGNVPNSKAIRVLGQKGSGSDLLYKQAGETLSLDEYVRRMKSKALNAKKASLRKQVQSSGKAPDYSPLAKTFDHSGANIKSLDSRVGAMVKLESITLKNNRLQSLPEVFANLKNIKTLMLAENWFTSLPSWFGELNQLKELNLNGNAFRDFPKEVRSLEQLDSLQISDNQLKRIPAWVGELSELTYMNLENNQLEGLPANLSFLSSLESINLSNNRFTVVPDCLLKLPKLQRVSLRGNPIDSSYKEKFLKEHPHCKRWF